LARERAESAGQVRLGAFGPVRFSRTCDMRLAVAFAAFLLMSACMRVVPEGAAPAPRTATPAPVQTAAVATPAAAVASSALAAGTALGPSLASLRWAPGDAQGALRAFRVSCPKILRREDVSGLTQRPDWQRACEAAARWSGDPGAFFRSEFEAVTVGDGQAFATGYFEPEILASRTRSAGYDTPIYAMPRDLTRAWPADMPTSERTGRPMLGRYDENGDFVLYDERAQIMAGSLEGRAPIIAYAADPVEFFFLQIQGSGLLRLPDGSLMRIGYAGQNGRGYTGIGRVLRENGQIGPGTPYATSMQGIMQFIRENPREGEEVMNLNKSWIFFRELDTDGPLGSLEVPVYDRDSVAVDPRFVPYGAPVWLDLDRGEADGLWIAQDTGGAIKGANRFDTFWGAGAEARRIAGGMSARGRALVLLPKSAAARLDRAR
jgi:membrane-bound lytic murein transglycosylase A